MAKTAEKKAQKKDSKEFVSSFKIVVTSKEVEEKGKKGRSMQVECQTEAKGDDLAHGLAQVLRQDPQLKAVIAHALLIS